MRNRVISSLILGFITIMAIIYYPLCGLVITILTILGLYEFFRIVENKGVKLNIFLAMLAGIAIPIIVYYRISINEYWQIFFVVISLIFLFLLELFKKARRETILTISSTIFGVIYIAWCLSFLLRIRQLPNGAVLLGFLIFVTKVSDIGAYLLGRRYGKHPLIKSVSPGKSLEGAIAGFLTSLIGGLIFSIFIPEISFVKKILLISIIAILSQLGDLFESLIKRDSQVKDSSSVIPGMGGVLDVIDSIIFTAPIFYLYIKCFN